MIGFTANVTDAVIPNVVGVDVGCGVFAVKIEEEASIELLCRLDEAAHKCIPVGQDVHGSVQISKKELASYECAQGFRNKTHLAASLGTLSGGNHFIELDQVNDGELWLVVHTGSRGIGSQLASFWQRVAVKQRQGATRNQRQELISRLKKAGLANRIESEMKRLGESQLLEINEDCCWLDGREKDGYLHDMALAQDFAHRNRIRIVELLAEASGVRLSNQFVESVHNYIDLDAGVIRKGAISARRRERVIIPLNMAQGCVLGVGLGNDDWNRSAPHGAGRVMSRREAFRELTMDSYRDSMRGVYSTTVCEETLDEAPMVYKDAGFILGSLAKTVEVECVMRPLWNFKATKQFGNCRK